ncbi:MAG: hypothetical protein L3J23_01405 [Flavobacteriaceae bacterium]|nr:hypothetical protein [Flavobacteriaceae bacterium]
MLKRIWNKGLKQKIFLSLFLLITIFVLFILRDDYQPVLLGIRKYIFIILVCILTIILAFKKIRKSDSNIKRILIFILLLIFFGILYFIGAKTGMYTFMQKYNIYKNLDLTEITKLPTTKNERIQPYNNIVTMAYESIGETEEVSPPQLVRIDGENRWTMAIQPAKEYIWQRISDNTEEIFSVPSTTAFPRFAGDNRKKVTFSIGESLSFSRNTYNAVVQRLNPWQYLNLEPEEVFYMKNDAGNWVQIVSLIKWKGFLFPYPTFGGVMVIENGKHTTKDYIERLLFGKGKYISAEKMKNYPYLKGQNTLSEKVSRLQAESLKFLGGFSDPLPWNMKTSVKIPDLKDDQNQQPFVTDFNFEGIDIKAHNGLYHWFGLEPIGKERTSLSYSVFIPSDGNKHLMYYDHAKNKEGFAGVSAMPLKVMESKKEFDWSVNKPVEFRPYIKDIAGKRRMFVLSTIAAKRENSKKFDGSATPDLALIDMEYRDVIWVDVKTPEKWDMTILKQLGSVWKTSEPNNVFFKDYKFTENLENKNLENIWTTKDSLGIVNSTAITDSILQPVKIDTVTNKFSAQEKIKKLEAKRDSLKIIKLQKEINNIKTNIKE